MEAFSADGQILNENPRSRQTVFLNSLVKTGLNFFYHYTPASKCGGFLRHALIPWLQAGQLPLIQRADNQSQNKKGTEWQRCFSAHVKPLKRKIAAATSALREATSNCTGTPAMPIQMADAASSLTLPSPSP